MLEGAAEDPAHDTRIGAGFAAPHAPHSICRRRRRNRKRSRGRAPRALVGPRRGRDTSRRCAPSFPPGIKGRASRGTDAGGVRGGEGEGGGFQDFWGLFSLPFWGVSPPSPRIYSGAAATPRRPRVGAIGAPTEPEQKYGAFFHRAPCVSVALLGCVEKGRYTHLARRTVRGRARASAGAPPRSAHPSARVSELRRRPRDGGDKVAARGALERGAGKLSGPFLRPHFFAIQW